jgi:hypothetical protein
MVGQSQLLEQSLFEKTARPAFTGRRAERNIEEKQDEFGLKRKLFFRRKTFRIRQKRKLARRQIFDSHCHSLGTGAARRYIFKPKIPIWVNFGGP